MQFVISRKFLDAVIEGQIFMHPKFRVPLSLPVPPQLFGMVEYMPIHAKNFRLCLAIFSQKWGEAGQRVVS